MLCFLTQSNHLQYTCLCPINKAQTWHVHHIHPIYPLLELIVHMCLGTGCRSSNTWSQLLYTINNLNNGRQMDRTCFLKLLLELLGLLWWVESKRNPSAISTFNWLYGCQMGNCHYFSETLFILAILLKLY